MNTYEAFRQIRNTRDHTRATEIARTACNLSIEGRNVAANGMDNGWSTTAVYQMPDGGEIRCDGRGWVATMSNGREIVE